MYNNIPRLIHQTWKTHTVPGHYKKAVRAWSRVFPGWKHKLWSHEEMDKYMEQQHPDFFHAVFKLYPHDVQRADAFRYFVLYDQGGLYADLKNEPLKNFESWFFEGDGVKKKPAYLTCTANLGRLHFCNGFMASAKNAPFWLDVIREMEKAAGRWNGLGVLCGRHLTVMNTTGVLMLSRASQKTHNPIVRLPQPLFNPLSLTNEDAKPESELIRQHRGLTWASWDTWILLFIYKNRTCLAGLMIIVIFLIKGGVFRR